MTAAARFIVGGAALTLFAGALLLASYQGPPAPTAVSFESAAYTPLPTTMPWAQAAAQLLGRSPFSPTRNAFSRASPLAPTPTDIRLIVIFRQNGVRRASLVVGADQLIVGKGDMTPLGPVFAVEADAILLGAAGGRRIGLFDGNAVSAQLPGPALPPMPANAPPGFRPAQPPMPVGPPAMPTGPIGQVR